MKYRIAKKKIKRTPSIWLWLKSVYQWTNATGIHMGCGDNDSVGICTKFIDFDWEQCLINANKIGITSRYLKTYYNKVYATKYFYNQ